MHYVYILTNKKNGTLYTGVTRSLDGRMLQHRSKKIKGFTGRTNCTRLVYYESFDLAIDAIVREKRLKKWNRAWKIRLILNENAYWDDLSADWNI